MRILLVGSGNMAREYAKVLKDIDVDITVIGRGSTSADQFEKELEIPVQRGGFEAYLKNKKSGERFTHAIVATNVESLLNTTAEILEQGIGSILVEKPGGATLSEISKLGEWAKDRNVLIGYNRRFYSSVEKVRETIFRDGGVKSFNFEFTEWSNEISKLNKPEVVKRNWFLANSTHVVDLAFHLGGNVADISSYIFGQLDWHSPAVFSGAGVTQNGALFSYQANWDAPGRWGVEILTKKSRLYLRPMEKLFIQQLNSVDILELQLNDDIDKLYKPGIFKQTKAFLFGEGKEKLCSLKEHISNLSIYAKMTGYAGI